MNQKVEKGLSIDDPALFQKKRGTVKPLFFYRQFIIYISKFNESDKYISFQLLFDNINRQGLANIRR